METSAVDGYTVAQAFLGPGRILVLMNLAVGKLGIVGQPRDLAVLD